MGIELAQTASLADLSAAQLHFRSNPLMSVLTAQLTQYSTITRIFKRLSDIFFSLIAIIISSPIMLVVALLIKHEDGGPVFFRQQRIGIYGKPFTMYKFRSMEVQAPEKEKSEWTTKRDPRVTPIGRVIRKTSIDEMPQLFNVLRGDMSFVGPRPEVQEYTDLYTEEQRQVFLVRPGITGVASIRYRNENDLLAASDDPNRTYIQEILPEKLRLDLSYIPRAGVVQDIALIFETLAVVIRG